MDGLESSQVVNLVELHAIIVEALVGIDAIELIFIVVAGSNLFCNDINTVPVHELNTCRRIVSIGVNALNMLSVSRRSRSGRNSGQSHRGKRDGLCF